MTAATAGQTIGPFWHLLEDKSWADLTRFGAQGERIVLTGRVTDGDGMAFADGCVETWQSDPPASDLFPGFGRSVIDSAGEFRIVTLKPGPVAGRGNTQQAPHVLVCVHGRGLMRQLNTRFYFEGEALNAIDPLLTSIESPARRATLIAKPDGPGKWRVDIRLQGVDETVFLDI